MFKLNTDFCLDMDCSICDKLGTLRLLREALAPPIGLRPLNLENMSGDGTKLLSTAISDDSTVPICLLRCITEKTPVISVPIHQISNLEIAVTAHSDFSFYLVVTFKTGDEAPLVPRLSNVRT
jgi:hypothetical protein